MEKATFMPFLSSSFRFQNPVSSNENPGPGAYYSPEDKVDIVMDGEKQRNFNYFFKSNSKRSAFGERGQRRNYFTSRNSSRWKVQLGSV